MLSPFNVPNWLSHLTPLLVPGQFVPGKHPPPLFEGRGGERIRLGLSRHHRLYKFSESEWIDAFFSEGSVRVGTLFEYHHVPADGRVRQDDREGIHQFYRSDGAVLVTPALNQWIFCVATSYNDSRRRRFGGEGYEIKDVRFFLEMTRALQREVSARLRDVLLAPVEYRGPKDLYRELGEGKFAGLIKGSEYAWQSEARAAWEFFEPQEQDVVPPDPPGDLDATFASLADYLRRQTAVCEPIVLKVPDARKYCRRLSSR